MTRYLIAGLIAALAVLGLFTWGQQGHSEARRARLEAQAIATQRDSAFEALRLSKRAAEHSAQIERERAAVAVEQHAARAAQLEGLKRALKDNPGWSSTRLPDGVRDALRAAGAAPGQVAAPAVATGGSRGAPAARRDERRPRAVGARTAVRNP